MKALLLTLTIVALLGGVAMAQDDPRGLPDPTEGGEQFFNTLTPSEVETLIAMANERRLTLERQQVAAELRQDLLFDPDEVAEAITYLDANPASSREQSVQRIYEALATVDADFDKALQQYTNGQFAEAAATVARDISPNEATYLAAARQLLHADCLRDAGEAYPALDAYDALLKNMSERMSFASTATLHAAELCRSRREYIDAMSYYAFALKNYGLTLTDAEYDDGLDFIIKYKAIYENPMVAVAGMMEDVEQRLAQGDSSAETQAVQDEIIAILEDLVATNPPGANQPPPQGRAPKRGEEEDEKKPDQDGKPQPKKSSQRATSPMTESAISEGTRSDATAASREYTSEESGDWATLPPREREKLQELARQAMDERHRKLAVDYHERLAGADEDSE